jgi:hypothetical protein
MSTYEDFRNRTTSIVFPKDENLVLGWLVDTGTPERPTETLYALRRDGRVRVSPGIPQPNANFNKPGRVWADATDVEMDAEFIGNYPGDMF